MKIIRFFSPQRRRENTEETQRDSFRLFRYFRLFRHLKKSPRTSAQPLRLCGEILFALVISLCLWASPLFAQKQSKQAKAAQQAAEQRYQQAVAFLKQGNPARAAAEFRAVLQLFPTFAEAHNGLGLALGQQGQSEEAIAAFQQAIQLNPIFTEARLNLGIALEQKNDLNSAINEYREIRSTDEHHGRVAKVTIPCLELGTTGHNTHILSRLDIQVGEGIFTFKHKLVFGGGSIGRGWIFDRVVHGDAQLLAEGTSRNTIHRETVSRLCQ